MTRSCRRTLEHVFFEHLNEWEKHSEFISSPIDYIDCDAYRNLVVLGNEEKRKVLGLVRDNYDKIPSLGLAFLVRDIAEGKFEVPLQFRGHVKETNAYTFGWLTGMLVE